MKKQYIGNSWDTHLKSEYGKPYFKEMMANLDQFYQDRNVYPDKSDIFIALRYCPLEKIKIVILGQDPYHGPNQADGLAFSIKEGQKIPPSLRNIFKELRTDIGCEIPRSGSLKSWAKEGILLLNSVLTVEEGKAGSHKKLGWHSFSDEVIRLISTKGENIIFILWGNFASSKKSLIDLQKHTLIETVHPSPLSASRGFHGSKPFSKANKILKENNIKPVDWSLPAWTDEENNVADKLHTHLKEVRVKGFKNVNDMSIQLSNINIVIGENNAGKSRLLQAIHFGISVACTAEKIIRNEEIYPIENIPISYSEIKYHPSQKFESIFSSAHMSTVDFNFVFTKEKVTFRLDCDTYRGDNINFNTIDKEDFILPNDVNIGYSYYIPGISGISVNEEQMSRQSVLELSQMGDANQVLRNSLNFLWQNRRDWHKFTNYFKCMFPNMEVSVDDSGRYIVVEILVDEKYYVLLEEMGSSVIQIIHLLSYVLLFKPTVMLLDEPDTHLQPSKQLAFLKLLDSIAMEMGIQFILTSHSDILIEDNGVEANRLLIDQNGVVEISDGYKRYHNVIRAIGTDRFKRLLMDQDSILLLTEDKDTSYLELLVNEANSQDADISVLSYKGVSKLPSVELFMAFIKQLGLFKQIIIHLDRDAMTDNEIVQIKEKYKKHGILVFVTEYSDIEGYFVNEHHMEALFGISSVEIAKMIDEEIGKLKEKSKRSFIDPRYNKLKNPDKTQNAHEEIVAWYEKKFTENPKAWTKGKTLLKAMKSRLQKELGYTPKFTESTPHLYSEELALIINNLAVCENT